MVKENIIKRIKFLKKSLFFQDWVLSLREWEFHLEKRFSSFLVFQDFCKNICNEWKIVLYLQVQMIKKCAMTQAEKILQKAKLLNNGEEVFVSSIREKNYIVKWYKAWHTKITVVETGRGYLLTKDEKK